VNGNRVEEFLHGHNTRDSTRQRPSKIKSSKYPENHIGVTIPGYTLPKCDRSGAFTGDRLVYMTTPARIGCRLLSVCLLLVLIIGLGNTAVAAAQLEPAPTTNSVPTINSGDNAWLLASTALVLMMTAPGLVLFYGGLVRSKNVLSTMMHSLILMAVISTLWMVFGYSVAFSSGNAFFGNPLTHLFLKGVGGMPNPAYAATVPAESFMLFQMMFAIITPALISGAVAERVRFKAYLLFIVLWTVIVYLPLCHMMWGRGGLFNWASGGKIPVLDFAGGTVVHISSGVSALVFALVIGRRTGFPREPMMPHNVVLSLIGAGLLWVGWFGFNAGSALNAGALATSAFAATHFSAAAAALSWTCAEWYLKGKPSVLGAASGMVAGLATITPASGFVSVPAAFGIGLVAGVVCYLAVTKLKAAFGYDDSLDVFGVHGVGSTVGMLMLGFLASAEVNPLIGTTFQKNGVAVSLAGGMHQFWNQLAGVGATVALAAIATFLILKLVDATIGLRVDQEDESVGLDLSQHGERAYNE
jgi:Amt family ammonium transporter